MQQENVKKWKPNKRIVSLYWWGLKLSAQVHKDLEERNWNTLAVSLVDCEAAGHQSLILSEGGINDLAINYPPQNGYGLKIHSKAMVEWLVKEIYGVGAVEVDLGFWALMQDVKKWSAEWDDNVLVVSVKGD